MLWSKCLVVWTYAVTPSLIKNWLVVVGEGVFLINMHCFDEVHKKRRLIMFARGSHLCSYRKYSVSSFHIGVVHQNRCSFILYIYYSLACSLIMTLRTMLCFPTILYLAQEPVASASMHITYCPCELQYWASLQSLHCVYNFELLRGVLSIIGLTV